MHDSLMINGLTFGRGLIAIVFAVVLGMAAAFPVAHAELLTKDGLDRRGDYLKRVEALVTALSEADRSKSVQGAAAFRSLVVTLDAALRDLRLSEGVERAGKVAPPTGLSVSRAPNSEGSAASLVDVPDDWLLQSVGQARSAIARLLDGLESGEPLNSARVDAQIAEIVDHVRTISQPR